MTDYTELAKRISEFSDGGARLWDYSPSHDRLVVRLQSKDRSRTAYLVFIGVQRMSIPTFWTPGQSDIRTADDEMLLFTDGVASVWFMHEASLQATYEE